MSYIKSLLIISIIITTGIHGRLIEVASEDVFNSLMADNHRPTILKFAAHWCSACQSITAPFKEIAESNEFNDVDFYIIDIDKMPDLTKKYSIIGIPTFIFIDNKKEIKRESGVKDPVDFKKYFSNKVTQTFSGNKKK